MLLQITSMYINYYNSVHVVNVTFQNATVAENVWVATFWNKSLKNC